MATIRTHKETPMITATRYDKTDRESVFLTIGPDAVADEERRVEAVAQVRKWTWDGKTTNKGTRP